MVGWHHRLSGCEFEQAPKDGEGQGSLEQAPKDGEGQGSLVSCSPWGHRVGHAKSN